MDSDDLLKYVIPGDMIVITGPGHTAIVAKIEYSEGSRYPEYEDIFTIEAGGDTASRIISFKDEMTLQKVKLPGEIRFSEITFEITDVYLSGKDNDTGISEIEFYSKGNKVEINVNGVN